jgi:hypothetical protein
VDDVTDIRLLREPWNVWTSKGWLVTYSITTTCAAVINMSSSTALFQFRCDHGQTIISSYRVDDGWCDCVDGSDEAIGQCYSPPILIDISGTPTPTAYPVEIPNLTSPHHSSSSTSRFPTTMLIVAIVGACTVGALAVIATRILYVHWIQVVQKKAKKDVHHEFPALFISVADPFPQMQHQNHITPITPPPSVTMTAIANTPVGEKQKQYELDDVDCII